MSRIATWVEEEGREDARACMDLALVTELVAGSLLRLAAAKWVNWGRRTTRNQVVNSVIGPPRCLNVEKVFTERSDEVSMLGPNCRNFRFGGGLQGNELGY
jgi:hypothetical protein